MHTVMERQEHSDANIYSKLSISTTPSYHVINMKNVSFWKKINKYNNIGVQLENGVSRLKKRNKKH